MAFGLYGSTDSGDIAIFFKLNQHADLKMVPKFPGSLILSSYIHLAWSRSRLMCSRILQRAPIPDGEVVEEIFLN